VKDTLDEVIIVGYSIIIIKRKKKKSFSLHLQKPTASVHLNNWHIKQYFFCFLVCSCLVGLTYGLRNHDPKASKPSKELRELGHTNP
jgi:hypothetical protein